MRNISRKAALAFRANKRFSLGNTTVSVSPLQTTMYLFGHCIAQREHAKHGISMVSVTLAGWGTPTTRERLNGLLEMLGSPVGFYQKNHEQYLGEEQVDSSDWNTIGTRC